MDGYSKLVSWEVTNFMSISHGLCEFDEKGIINIKGYNDSGKSAMLRALDVLFYNKHQRDQVSFIKDGCTYFRVVAKFDDGVIILRDKYANGQSLYEMYKGNDIIFTTKVNNTLTRVSEVPEVIEAYLGVNVELCSRSCYDPQFAVQTSGSENYKKFSSILKAEELVKASSLLNNDKNKLSSDITIVDNQLSAYREVVKDGSKLTEDLVVFLENLDRSIDTNTEMLEVLNKCKDLTRQVNEVHIAPKIDFVDSEQYTYLIQLERDKNIYNNTVVTPSISKVETDRLDTLLRLQDNKSVLNSIVVTPNIDVVDLSCYTDLLDLKSMCDSLDNDYVITPEVSLIDAKRLVDLQGILNSYKSMPDLDSIDREILTINEKLEGIKSQFGDNIVICPDCGSIIEGV